MAGQALTREQAMTMEMLSMVGQQLDSVRREFHALPDSDARYFSSLIDEVQRYIDGETLFIGDDPPQERIFHGIGHLGVAVQHAEIQAELGGGSGDSPGSPPPGGGSGLYLWLAGVFRKISAQLWNVLKQYLRVKEWKLSGEVGGILGFSKGGVEITFGP